MPQNYLSSQKMESFTNLFIHFDYYSTGTIHYTSLYEIMKSLQIQMQMPDIYDLLNDVGNKNPTMIKLDQFLAIFSILIQDKQMGKQIQMIFRIFDADKNQVINKEDIKKAMSQLNIPYNEQQIKDMLKITKKKQLNFKQFEQGILKNL